MKSHCRSLAALGAAGLAAVTLIGGTLTGGAAPAGAAEKVIIVVDSSGSMAQRAGNRTRMAAARSVIGDLVEGWNSDKELGLIAYGHRRKGACDDIEVIAPVGAVKPGALKRAIGRLRPVGKTPLSAAVERAAELLKYTEDKATVVLISDGKENCRADPCALGRKLEERGVDFTAHVIGFDVAKSERAGLRCLAENTGGRYLDAGDAGALKAALGETVQDAQPAAAPFRFEAVLAEGGAPLTDGVGYRVYKDDGGKRGDRVKIYREARPEVGLEPGRYIVQVRRGKFRQDHPLTVSEDPDGTTTFVLNAGYARLRAHLDEGADALKKGVKWVVERKGGDYRVTDRSARETLLLPAGDYSAAVKYGRARASEDFSVAAGKTVEVAVVLGAGVLAVDAVYAEGGPAVKKGGKWGVFSAKASLTGKRDRVATSRGATRSMRLPAGDYLLRYRKGRATAETEVTVKANERTEATVNLEAGVLALQAKLPAGASAKGVRLYVFKAKKALDGSRERVDRRRGAKYQRVLNAGEYFVRAELRGSKPRPVGTATVTVKAGERTEATVTIEPAAKEE